jgi:hypothetical protein
MRNRIINGDFKISQYNGTSSVTPSGNAYIIDRYRYIGTQASKFTFQQLTTTPPTGFTYYLGATVASAVSVGASDYFFLCQRIEGLNSYDLDWGTANAKTVTFSFLVRSSLTGTFGGVIQNGPNNYSYPFTYSIASANTWTSISVTVAGPTAGSWVTNNDSNIQVNFGLGAGATFSGTAGSWSANQYYGVTGAVSVVGTAGATWQVTGVQFEVGTQATSFEYRQYGTELNLCQRYFQSIAYAGNAILTIGLCTATTSAEGTINLLQTMRSTPTITLPAAGQTAGTISYLTSNGTYPATTGTNTPNNISVNNFTVTGASYSASFVQGNAGWLYATGSVTIKASAEL